MGGNGSGSGKKKTLYEGPEIFIQSPMGGNITPEAIGRKIPADAECAYVRVDQNRIWWVRGEEYGSVVIWD